MIKLSYPSTTKKKALVLTAGWVMLALVVGRVAFGSVDSRENSVVRTVRRVSPAVVNISSQYEIRKNSNPFSGYGIDPLLENFFRDFFSPELERRERRTSLGSGVIIDGTRGFVLTNTHVIEKGTTISVTLNDEREFEADIVGMDPDSDLAVLKIQTDQILPAIQMGDSDNLMIGESVIAIGNPFGFSHTVTTGVISAVNRSIKTDERVFHEFIQTDASINPGNSGGPLLNIDGELIGINTAIYAQAQGIGFAIPINRAKRIISDLINYGKVVQAWIGMTVQPLDANLSDYLDVQHDIGVMVTTVEPQSPASEAGIVEGDILLAIDGSKMTGMAAYRQKINEVPAGQSISLKINRNGQPIDVSLPTAIFPLERALALAGRKLGITVSDLDRQTRARFRVVEKKGVIIVKMRRNSELDRIGVRPGDIIRQIDDGRIANIEDFKSAIAKVREKTSVVLVIQREGHLYRINASMRES
ncbi:MAG: Do family serine endopeptidase, partial [Desulfosarcina sp.]